MKETGSCPLTYRAVCFDLDGTLLPFDLEEFLGSYYKRIALHVAAQGIDVALFKDALNAGTFAMTKNKGPASNAEVFWKVFLQTMDATTPQEDHRSFQEWHALFTAFYQGSFDEVGTDVIPDQNMVRAVQVLAQKGYPLLLTTMPLFPPEAVEKRLGWAGVDPGLFCRLTHYENSTAAKPSTRYYAENLAAMGLEGKDVLMVGNNTVEDLAFCKLGADAYLVTDYLLDPIDLDLSTVKHGSSAAFATWVEALPSCANPAPEVDAGPIDPARTEQVIAQGACLSEAQAQEAAREAAAAERMNARLAGDLSGAVTGGEQEGKAAPAEETEE